MGKAPMSIASSLCFYGSSFRRLPYLCRHACIGHRANDGALWRVKMPFTLGTLGRIDHIYVVLQANRGIGTLELTRTADGALGRDYLVSHHCDSISKKCGTVSCYQVLCQTA